MNQKSCIISVLVGIHLSVIASGQLYLNEIQSSNITTILDPDDNYVEWVEIFNSSSSTIDLEGYFLTEDLSNPEFYVIEDLVIRSGDYGIVWLSREGNDLGQRLRLYMDKGTLGMFGPDGTLIDSISYGRQYQDISFGRMSASESGWGYFPNPTPDAENGNDGYQDAERGDSVRYSLHGGIYSGTQILQLSTETPGVEIRFTVDGSWPGKSSNLYVDPIDLSETTVIRARGYQDGLLPGQVSTHTFLINETSTLPVISISTNPGNFFDSHYGIFVTGTNGITGYCADTPRNFNQDWERPINFEYFDRSGVQEVNQLTGTKIFGGCSRIAPVKSFAIYARPKYGENRLRYRFFETKNIDEFKTIILRNSGNDNKYTMLRDGFMQSLLVGQMDVDHQAYEPAIVFINGEYWGILNIREKVNEHFAESNFGIDADQVDMLEKHFYLSNGEVVNGDGAHYQELIEFIETHDLADQSNYDFVADRIDINEFINYYIAGIYFQNEDWPQNNVKYWRPHVEGGKWRWILFDTDHGWGLFPRSGNSLVWATEGDHHGSFIIGALLENENFKNEFVQRMAAHINTTFHPDRVTPIFEFTRDRVMAEMDRHVARWDRPEPSTFSYHIDTKMPRFTRDRPDILRGFVMDKFRIWGMYTLGVETAGTGIGHVRACNVVLPVDFTGSFFDHIPLQLVAVPESGYRFSHWEGENTSSDDTIYITRATSTSITAYFESAQPESGIVINEIGASPVNGIEDEFEEQADWIELHNTGDFDVDLGGWFLSDSAALLEKYMIPVGFPDQTTIRAGAYLVFWCDKQIRQGPLHTNFKLQRNGEELFLSQPVGQATFLRDSVLYPEIHPKLTYGRSYASGNWEFLSPSPMAANESGEIKNLIINEYLSKNCGKTLDEFGEADDWIEIYNPTQDSIDLAGLFLTDSLEDPLKHLIPLGDHSTTIPPLGHVVLWADGQPEQGPLHLGFKLDSKSEQIGLYQVGTGFVDSLSYELEVSGFARGRFPDGVGDFQWTSQTPGSANMKTNYQNLSINEVVASNRSTLQDRSGEFDDWLEIYNGNDYPVDIGGLYITDSLADLKKHRIALCHSDSTLIPALGHLVLFADNQEEQGVIHLGFRLDARGEFLGLSDPTGSYYLDSFTFGELATDQSFGRLGDGSDTLQFLTATPGGPNEVRFLENIHINEFMASNRSTYEDPFGEFDDWIEIYNGNNFAVDIGGIYISDSLDNPTRFRIPSHLPQETTIPAGGFLVLWADNQEEQGVLHLDFKLSADGEEIGLFQPDGSAIIDSLSFEGALRDQAVGRLADGSAHIQYLSASPGSANLVHTLAGIRINEFMARNESLLEDPMGEFDDWIELYNQNLVSVDVGGLFITDSLGEPSKYRIPSYCPDSTTIPAGGYLVLWADGQEEQGVLHLGFRLSSEGEEIGLVQADGMKFIDSLRYGGTYSNQAFGWLDDGSNEVQIVTATPGYKNYLSPTEKLYISEIVASGNNYAPDKSGEYDDWIEIYNDNDFKVDIGGLYITDSLLHLTKFRIPGSNPDSTTIGPKSSMILWADGQPGQGVNHLGFKLNGQGEQLALSSPDGMLLIDSLTFPDQYKYFSYSRMNSVGDWKFLPPTYEEMNVAPLISKLHITEFSSSNYDYPDDYGEYEDWIEIHNANSFQVNIGGLYLTDSLGNTTKYRIPSHTPEETIIPAGGYYVFFADGNSGQGIGHTNFRLGRDGEQIALVHYDEETVLDSLTYGEQYRNSSSSRLSGSGPWFPIPSTPGAPNELPDLSGLLINEVMGFNKTVYGDEYNEYEDWIELYNGSESPLNIAGLFVTDSLPDPHQFRISSMSPDSTLIPPGGYLILWADNRDDQGVLHLDMKISKTGEQIALFDYTGTLVDSMTYPFISPNLSWGRVNDGLSEWTRFFHPTPMQPNLSTSLDRSEWTGMDIRMYPNPVVNRAVFEIPSGEPGTIRLEIYSAHGTLVSLSEHSKSVSDIETIEWNVEDAPGGSLESGLYLYHISYGKNRYRGKFIVNQHLR